VTLEQIVWRRHCLFTQVGGALFTSGSICIAAPTQSCRVCDDRAQPRSQSALALRRVGERSNPGVLDEVIGAFPYKAARERA
jgi:hypothetical protein